ncbi:MAG: hypothetical protein JWO58_2492 [Chitinophagaceae bacterium]|nr:hypothetical protein [Chitinophagaceae bacterium]
MTVRRTQEETSILYFVTFTCIDWLDLIEQTNSYDFILNQFKICSDLGYRISGFVIMPNHVHLLIYIPEKGNINKCIGNMKRFISYEIVKRLSVQNPVLRSKLNQHVNTTDRSKGQKHDVFIRSFDAKPIYTRKFAEQKLSYMHDNPVKGKWQLSKGYISYPWSSVRYYEMTDFSFPFLKHYIDLV